MTAKKKAAKTAGKAAKKATTNLRPFKPGPDPRRNTTIAGPGRPPDEFKRRMAQIGSRDELLAVVERVVNDPAHPDWSRMVALVWDRAYGKAQAHVDVTSGGEPITVVSGVPEAE